MVAGEPAAGVEFLVLQMQFAALILCGEAHHEAVWIGPGLAGKVAYVADGEAGLLHHLAPNTLLQGLSRLYESRHQTVVTVAEVACVYHEDAVSALYAHDDGGGQTGP